jgi:hypothetical protein
MNDEGRLHSAPATSTILSAGILPTESDEITWPVRLSWHARQRLSTLRAAA